MAPSIQPGSRTEWLGRLLPEGIPQLWCPPLTHYTSSGTLDKDRIAAHWQFIAPWAKGLLVPGSTGDGWELSENEIEELLQLALELAPKLDVRVLIGALHPDTDEASRLIAARLNIACGPTAAENLCDILVKRRVCGFAVCPPRGSQVTQEGMETALSKLLQFQIPTALYQLPQVTQNEMSPELVSRLAQRFANFILFKDTSGRDLVATSGLNFQSVFLVRGMEGDYARWLKPAGTYDGFLLASANCFGRELHEIRSSLEGGRISEAQGFSDRISRVMSGIFEVVKPLSEGNLFANALKALDHFYAHGKEAERVAPPRLHSKKLLPERVIAAAGELLAAEGLAPERGYLDSATAPV